MSVRGVDLLAVLKQQSAMRKSHAMQLTIPSNSHFAQRENSFMFYY
jgi:hypothetical protein